MKKVLAIAVVCSAFLACGPTTGDKGVNEDGIQAFDSNGAFRDDTTLQHSPLTDSARGEDRMDIQKRDSVR